MEIFFLLIHKPLKMNKKACYQHCIAEMQAEVTHLSAFVFNLTIVRARHYKFDYE